MSEGVMMTHDVKEEDLPFQPGHSATSSILFLMLGDSSNFTRIASVMALAATDMAAVGIAFAPDDRRARHSWWDTAGMRSALVVTFCMPSRADRPVARRSLLDGPSAGRHTFELTIRPDAFRGLVIWEIPDS